MINYIYGLISIIILNQKKGWKKMQIHSLPAGGAFRTAFNSLTGNCSTQSSAAPDFETCSDHIYPMKSYSLFNFNNHIKLYGNSCLYVPIVLFMAL